MNQFEENLMQVGLTKTESHVYITLLTLGRSLHKTLSDKARIKRSSLYDLLPKLKEKGLVSETFTGKRKYLIAQDLANFIEQKKTQLERVEKDLPILKTLLVATSVRPVIEVYEGIEGIKQVWYDHLLKKLPIYEVVGIENIKPGLQKYIKQYYIIERSKRKIPLRMLISGTTIAGIFKVKSDPYEYREVRVVDGNLFPVPLGLDIYGNNVSITLHREDSDPVGLIIRSKEVSASLLSLFNLAWKAGVEVL